MNANRIKLYYVSTEGDDAWSGKLEKPNNRLDEGPFRTIKMARDAVREDIKNGLECDVTVLYKKLVTSVFRVLTPMKKIVPYRIPKLDHILPILQSMYYT